MNVSDICPRVVHQRSHRVAVYVTRSGFVDFGGLDVAAAVFGQRIGLDGSAIDRQEQRPFLGINGQLVAGMFDVTRDP